MELKKQPETELEYWGAIEALGGFSWRMNHDLSDGRIDDPSGSIDQDIGSARKIQETLVAELTEKFGVIHPKDCPQVEIGQKQPPAPEGKIYYWDWYEKMKKEVYHLEYEAMICSACPFSEGVDKMISLGGVVPCSVFCGMMYHLRAPHICGMTTRSSGDWSDTQLYTEILEKHGKEALVAFFAKEKELEPVKEKTPA
jgi:hypothetical protein